MPRNYTPSKNWNFQNVRGFGFTGVVDAFGCLARSLTRFIGLWLPVQSHGRVWRSSGFEPDRLAAKLEHAARCATTDDNGIKFSTSINRNRNRQPCCPTDRRSTHPFIHSYVDRIHNNERAMTKPRQHRRAR
ncbi:unnamed protein product [Soboliphyme baturini]|uniref:Transposase n=1 Tax=Soboliphyme baturini TaxID=241478 RepID=A0A183IQ15_9BILA|nr:unnamed protein product [Soboliphyme baturini]